MEVIVFETNNAVKVIFPALDCGLSVMDIGKKDVPHGVNFWIAKDSILPEVAIEAWEINAEKLGPAAGVGGTYVPVEIKNVKGE